MSDDNTKQDECREFAAYVMRGVEERNLTLIQMASGLLGLISRLYYRLGDKDLARFEQLCAQAVDSGRRMGAECDAAAMAAAKSEAN